MARGLATFLSVLGWGITVILFVSQSLVFLFAITHYAWLSLLFRLPGEVDKIAALDPAVQNRMYLYGIDYFVIAGLPAFRWLSPATFALIMILRHERASFALTVLIGFIGFVEAGRGIYLLIPSLLQEVDRDQYWYYFSPYSSGVLPSFEYLYLLWDAASVIIANILLVIILLWLSQTMKDVVVEIAEERDVITVKEEKIIWYEFQI